MSEPSTGLSAEYIENFQRRVLQDAMLEATAAYWERRAEALERALPIPGEFQGSNPDPDRERRTRAAALACRNHATFLRWVSQQ